MIPRKRLQILLYVMHVFYVFGDGDTTGTEGSSTSPVTKNVDFVQEVLTEGDISTFENNLHSSESIGYTNVYKEENASTLEPRDSDWKSINDFIKRNTIDTSSAVSDNSTEPIEFSNTISMDEYLETRESNALRLLSTDNETAAVQNLTITSIGTNDIAVSWTLNASRNDLNFYMIQWYQNTTAIGSCNQSSSLNSYIVRDLNPNTNYTITITPVTNLMGTPVSVYGVTKTSPISAVRQLNVTGLEYGLCASWISPIEASLVSWYYINVWYELDGKNISVSTSTTDLYVNITGLNACTKYNVEVIPYSSSEGNGTAAFTTGDTLDCVPGAPTDLITSISGFWVLLTWEAPTTNIQCLLHYFVTTCSRGNCTTTTVTVETYNVTNLNPCVDYTFSVTAVGNAGESANISTSATTSYVTPGAPLLLTATPGQFSLNISWQMPTIAATCIKHYRITLWDTVTETTTNNYIRISGLYACMTYTAQVNAVGITNGDGPFDTTIQTTEESVTDAPVLNVSPWVTMSTISIGWRILSYMNNCPLYSVVTVCNWISTDGHGFELLSGMSTDSISSLVDLLVNITVSDLSPFTTYSCQALTINSAGNSSLSTVVSAITSEDVPSAPTFNVIGITNTNFTLTWSKPDYLAGYLTTFEVILDWDTLFLMPDWCQMNRVTSTNISDIDGSSLAYTYASGVPYSNYSARIRARTGAGWGVYSDWIYFETKIGVPGTVELLSYSITNNENDPDTLDTTVSWSLPCALHGEIDYFHISVYGTRTDFNDDFFDRIYNITTAIGNNDIFSINLGELKAEYNYTFEVSAKVIDLDVLGAPDSTSVLYPAGIPAQPSKDYVKLITLDPQKAQRTTTTAVVLLPIFPHTNGEILFYAITVSEVGYNTARQARLDIRNGNWPNISAWQESMLAEFVIPYQATRKSWNPAYSNHVVDYGHMSAVKYVIGEDITCKELSANTESRLYCNGPLKPDMLYHVRMRAFTSGGYADSVTFTVKTDAELNVAFVIGVVFGILFLGLIITMMLLVRKGSLQSVLRRLLHSDMPGSPVPAPFTRRKFIAHCQQLAENPGKLSNEFQLLQTLSIDLQMPTNAACLQANKKKNRYTDILPYDFSRVKLEIIDNDPNSDSDYINASFIRGYSGTDEYIACQGPKDDTTYDFWRMVDQYDVKIIVMLTQLVEKGKEKCHQYFPTIRESFNYEHMTIRCTSELDFRTYTQRTLALQKDNEKRNIMHLHFKDWPDHDVPEDFESMIHFCQIMRRQMSVNKGLVVVHCSAGIGRTGTLIALDILLQSIRDNRKLDVFGTVYRLRRCRINMVQRESQYAYIYNCIRQVLKNPFCLKSYKPPPVDPIYENISRKKKERSSSNMNLVSSLETLRKSSPTPSIDSTEPMFDSSPQPILKSQISTTSNGLRYSKSTSAIHSKTPQVPIGKYGSQEYPVYESIRDSESLSSKQSTERGDISGSRSSTYENLPNLTRSKSVHTFGKNQVLYSYMSQKSLQKDTSI
ncbi:receptor-type tyrosine-protein phosphatase eta [Cephus cinctus]|uniref:protein-tyrosine-phosphatase n=1 Tax=Cephus cinctus TaxID=211228 RepID=A0AAJ7RRG5_CEPCN|nr:receptor-type tyrosine-protein phosphatase eta [Cephus cinctus]XP_024945807.1 receptor-type tyrosine-protein phosphatase eta [Cephus cinctus]XP_024945808.1 receptor-type tyrosine-protein phosphatase eta [Cephus cinctus]XP_024945809.1 receptor-type tyrosine-protein phosphatase eta [Cephus cinctus]XP_024945810.1 receptor-type tyrosine-protein phosphatase eta [Cephus cinctus]